MQQRQSTAGLSDLEVIIFGSPRASKALYWLFFLSVFVDLEMLFAPMLTHSEIVHGLAIGSPVHLFWSVIGIAIMVGGSTFWLAMFYLFLRAPWQGFVRWMVWMALFMFTVFIGAQLYYLISFRKRVQNQRRLLS